ncbi:haloacid dehalogenase [Nonlabens spongiae]|uniref:phosphoglycolate phosphatase n=1 Tax=Nonlabens spongiae TaxID=331648 RepID=A0A1W6MG39_9FLAO|nr:HAD hydrolase-like protein [Nonlabens spongiae]ARN76542.1 haloacid dehalogenase [Nonlabens spongiae]
MIKNIFWDFDGVLMNSNSVRDRGFELVLKDFPTAQVEQLMQFHRQNGGWSRYVKFRHFFEVIRKESISPEEIDVWAGKFSNVMLENLIDEKLLIDETITFVKSNFRDYNFHIVSGSDGNELRTICKALNIDPYFITIEGSPTPKSSLVADIIENRGYLPQQSILIGDSINDYDAAKDNGLHFKGYNSSKVEVLTDYDFSFHDS